MAQLPVLQAANAFGDRRAQNDSAGERQRQRVLALRAGYPMGNRWVAHTCAWPVLPPSLPAPTSTHRPHAPARPPQHRRRAHNIKDQLVGRGVGMGGSGGVGGGGAHSNGGWEGGRRALGAAAGRGMRARLRGGLGTGCPTAGVEAGTSKATIHVEARQRRYVQARQQPCVVVVSDLQANDGAAIQLSAARPHASYMRGRCAPSACISLASRMKGSRNWEVAPWKPMACKHGSSSLRLSTHARWKGSMYAATRAPHTGTCSSTSQQRLHLPSLCRAEEQELRQPVHCMPSCCPCVPTVLTLRAVDQVDQSTMNCLQGHGRQKTGCLSW